MMRHGRRLPIEMLQIWLMPIYRHFLIALQYAAENTHILIGR